MMHNDANRLEQLMQEIIRVTDVMYQAIIADSFEIFESALDERGLLLQEYEKLIKDTPISRDKTKFVETMNNYEVKIHKELKRFDKKMHDEYSSTRRQLKALQDGQKKTQRYSGEFGRVTNGSYFDRKK